ncbi:hypothetical protein BHK69_19445 [Bosea vaviloviae]|uniref:Uncharacterized protein n=1 Tax=Bosea vaviloviae TaxID=1526658 RepID=A0A1D7U4Q7_9HYPH|nr:hypothetical protein BHK69_19445 [Bosea vaviloviae]
MSRASGDYALLASIFGEHPVEQMALQSQLSGLHSIRTRWPGCANVWQDTAVGRGAGVSVAEAGMSFGWGATGLGVARRVGTGCGLLGCRILVDGVVIG